MRRGWPFPHSRSQSLPLVDSFVRGCVFLSGPPLCTFCELSDSGTEKRELPRVLSLPSARLPSPGIYVHPPLWYHCYAPSPYLQTNRESEQVHCGNAKERREFFISSALGLKPHLMQRNQTRARNKAVWRFISQLQDTWRYLIGQAE